MIEIRWQYDPASGHAERVPTDPREARTLLDEGNASFAALGGPGGLAELVVPVTAGDLGLPEEPGSTLRQAPFAAVVACADARVPVELVLGQAANDIFVVRVAGNVLASECVGSIDYAVGHLSDLRLIAVLGHSGCGAVGAAVDTYLDPGSYLGLAANLPLRTVVDPIVAVVRGADAALLREHGRGAVDLPGYRAALVELTVVLNAGLAAATLRTTFAAALGPRLDVAVGVYDLASRQVGLPGPTAWLPGLQDPPGEDSLDAWVRGAAGSAHVARMLDAADTDHH